MIHLQFAQYIFEPVTGTFLQFQHILYHKQLLRKSNSANLEHTKKANIKLHFCFLFKMRNFYYPINL